MSSLSPAAEGGDVVPVCVSRSQAYLAAISIAARLLVQPVEVAAHGLPLAQHDNVHFDILPAFHALRNSLT